MILVVDGHDLAGKSTILKHFDGYPIIKMPVDDAVYENIELCSYIFNETILQFRNLIKNNVIFMDRWWLSSIVYGEFFHRPFNLKYINEIYKKLKKEIIYFNIYCSDEEINRRYHKKKDSFFNPTIIKSIKYLYLREGLKYKVINLRNEAPKNLKTNIEIVKRYAK